MNDEQKLRLIFNRERIHYFVFKVAIFCIAGSLPFSIQLNNIGIITLGVYWLVSGNLKGKINAFFRNYYALVFASLYLCYGVGLLYSEHPQIGFLTLENKLSILIFPLLLSYYINYFDKKFVEQILIVFVISCFIATSISAIHALNLFLKQSDPAQFLYREAIIDFFGYHPTYLSIYLFFCIIFYLFYCINYYKILTIYHKITIGILIAFTLLICLLLSARMPFIAFLLIFTTSVYYSLYKKKRIKWIVIITFILIAFLYSIYQIPAVNRRFIEITYTPLKPPVGIYHNSTNLRVGILYCSLDILKNNWLVGVGTGDMQPALNSCYQLNGFSEVMYKNSYDPHSQFIEVWLNVGVFGLFILLLNFALPMRLAWQQKNWLFLSFLTLLFLCCLTESVLNLQKGVVFYSFFNSIFTFHLLREKAS